MLSGGFGQQEAPAPEPDRGATGRGLPQSGQDIHPKEGWTTLPEGIKRLMFAPPLLLKAQSHRQITAFPPPRWECLVAGHHSQRLEAMFDGRFGQARLDSQCL